MHLAGHVQRLLIVCPTSICGVWEAEFAGAAAFPYTLAVLLGSADKRVRLLGQLRQTHGGLQVAVINYESAWRADILAALTAYAPDMIVCDESQRIKNHAAKQSKALHALGARAKYRMILTGTPIQRDPRDVWSQWRFLEPAVFPTSYYAFQARYARMGGFQNKQYLSPMHLDELTGKVHALSYRVRKEDCLDLPDKVFEVRPVRLEPSAARLYRQLQREAVAELSAGEVTAAHVLTRMLRLQQMVGGYTYTDDGRRVQVSTAKLDAAADAMETVCLDEGRKLVIMARFLDEVDALEEAARKHGIGLVRVDGGVPAWARGELVRRFQTEPGCQLFVGIIDACAEGLTLTAADTMLYYSLTFNFAKYDQSLSRIHRISQKHTCTYIHLVAPGTIDEKIMSALRNKEDLARSVVDNWRQLLGE